MKVIRLRVTGAILALVLLSNLSSALANANAGTSTVIFSANGGNGFYASVDGTNYSLPASFNWMDGSTHQASIKRIVYSGVSARQVFTGWTGDLSTMDADLLVFVRGNMQLTANYLAQYLVTLMFTTAEGEEVIPSSVVLFGPEGETGLTQGSQLWLNARSSYTFSEVVWSNVTLGLTDPSQRTIYISGPATFVVPLTIYRDTIKVVDVFGLPVSGVTLRITTFNGRQFTKLTDSKGVASFELPLGSYSAELTALGITTSFHEVSIGAHSTTVTLVLSYPSLVLLNLFVLTVAVVEVGRIRKKHREEEIANSQVGDTWVRS